jgi:hypothetical protein
MVENQVSRYVMAHIDEIDSLPEKDRTREWKPIRHHFAVGSFGVNLFRSTAAGELLTHLHDETDTGHEELFFVAQGDARFSVDGDEFDTPAGTFVHVVEPSAIRGVWAKEAGCVLLVIGGKPGTGMPPDLGASGGVSVSSLRGDRIETDEVHRGPDRRRPGAGGQRRDDGDRGLPHQRHLGADLLPLEAPLR